MSSLPPLSPAALYYIAAAINLASIPKHTLVGLNAVAPAIDSIPSDKPEHKKAKQIVPVTWQYINTALAVNALLNLSWASSPGRTRSRYDALIVAVNFVGCVLVGYRYFAVRMYPGLPVLWGASTCSAVAMLYEMNQG